MSIDISNLVSGFIGAAIGILGAFGIAFLQNHWARKAAKKQMDHTAHLQRKQHKHDKDLQYRERNIQNTGIASLREVGGG